MHPRDPKDREFKSKRGCASVVSDQELKLRLKELEEDFEQPQPVQVEKKPVEKLDGQSWLSSFIEKTERKSSRYVANAIRDGILGFPFAVTAADPAKNIQPGSRLPDDRFSRDTSDNPNRKLRRLNSLPTDDKLKTPIVVPTGKPEQKSKSSTAVLQALPVAPKPTPKFDSAISDTKPQLVTIPLTPFVPMAPIEFDWLKLQDLLIKEDSRFQSIFLIATQCGYQINTQCEIAKVLLPLFKPTDQITPCILNMLSSLFPDKLLSVAANQCIMATYNSLLSKFILEQRLFALSTVSTLFNLNPAPVLHATPQNAPASERKTPSPGAVVEQSLESLSDSGKSLQLS